MAGLATSSLSDLLTSIGVQTIEDFTCDSITSQLLGVIAAITQQELNKTKKKQPSAGYRFALAALKKFNIGLLFVSDPTVPGIEKPVEQPYEPTFIVDAHHAAATYKLREWLKPEHKTMAKAGTSGAGIVTPFRLTALRLTQIVRDTGGWMLLRDALVLAKSHYKSINGGTASMADMIAKGIVTGLEIKRDGRRVFVRAT